MSTKVPRSIIVDDVDSKIHYTGPWFPDQGSQDSVGSYGPPFRNTLHGTNANASFSFAFNGTRVIAYGSNNIRNDSGVLDPTCQCFIDNISIGVRDPFAYQENNWYFCKQDTLTDGPHILTVNVTVMKNQTFWFDNIQYVPSASVPLDQAAMFIDRTDAQLEYGPGWQDYGGFADLTTVKGSIFTFNFIGVSLSWFGYIPAELPLSPSPATYSIDGQTPINFTLKGLPPKTITFYNQKFFETGQLSAGRHMLEVVYQGTNSTPLTLNQLVVQNGTLPSATTAVPSHGTSTNGVSGASGASTSSSGKSSTPVGAIVGGVIGGLALIVFVILGLLLLRRRQERVAKEKVLISTPKPFTYTPLHPPNTTPNHSLSGDISYSQSPQTVQKGSAMMYSTSGYTYGSMPSTNAQPLLPTPLPVPSQSSSSPLPSQSSSSPLPSHPSSSLLPNRTKREAEALTALGSQRQGDAPPAMTSMQSNDTRPSSVVLHEDSGVRMPPSASTTGVPVEVPPLYTEH